MIRYLTSGESHGKAMLVVIEGLPAGLSVEKEEISKELARRRQGYGRSSRMKIEEDRFEILTGLRKGKTLGSPLTLIIYNQDYRRQESPVTIPRPGHADLAGLLKYNFTDVRDVWERASARETVARVGAGAIARQLLDKFKIKIYSQVASIGPIEINPREKKIPASPAEFIKMREIIEKSALHCLDKNKELEMMRLIDKAQKNGDTLGGTFEVIILNVPIGLGSYAQWDRRLDARLSQALMSIPGVKAVEIGMGFSLTKKFGSQVHDQIYYKKGKGFFHKSNNAGGIEGGISNGEPIILRAAMKPIPTLANPLMSVDLSGKKPAPAPVMRSDICAVPAAGVIGEAVCALEMVNFLQEKFGGDSLSEMQRNYHAYLHHQK